MVSWLFLFLSLPVFALDLRTAINSAIENSPYIKGLPSEGLIYEGKRLSYRSGLNPTLSVEAGNFGTSKEGFSRAPIYGITYTQPLSYPALFRGAGEVYRLQNIALQHRIESEKNRLAQDVYLLFYQALYTKELLRVAEEELKLQREIRDFVERSFRLGEITRLELFRAQRETELLEGEKRLMESRYRALLGELSALAGREISDVEGELILPQWRELEPEMYPLFAYYRTGIQSLSKQIELEKLLSRPFYSVSLTAEKVADREYGLRIGLVVGLPFFYRRQGEVLELKAQQDLLSAEAQAQKQKALAQLRSSKTQFEQIIREVEKIEKDLIPNAQKELELALKSYRLRTITLLELSQTRKSYYELLRRKLELMLMAHTEFAKGIAYGGSQWCGCY